MSKKEKIKLIIITIFILLIFSIITVVIINSKSNKEILYSAFRDTLDCGKKYHSVPI